MSLYKSIDAYNNSNSIRFHMPGHKGKDLGLGIYGLDVTEVLDFDDLHNPTGRIKKIEERLSNFFGASYSKLLVNGSTSGIMTAIFSVINEGDKVLLSRFCHRSVFNALALRKAIPIFVPQKVDSKGVLLPIEFENIEQIIEENDDIKLALFTYPTYEGVISQIKDINNYLKNNNISVVIDAAHGAHIGLMMEDKHHLMSLNADIVVTSLHKTLPFLTQTAVLLLSEAGKRFENKIKFYEKCFQTSSPSYILMLATELGLDKLEQDGELLAKKHKENIEEFKEKCEGLENIFIVTKKEIDPTKIIVSSTRDGGIHTILECFRQRNIVPEMYSSNYILCLTSIMDDKDSLEKLFLALEEADLKITNNDKNNDFSEALDFAWVESELSIHEAIDSKPKYIDIEEALNRVSAGFVELYPPGVPVILPGEIIKKEAISIVKKAKENNINIIGLDNNRISVI